MGLVLGLGLGSGLGLELGFGLGLGSGFGCIARQLQPDDVLLRRVQHVLQLAAWLGLGLGLR